MEHRNSSNSFRMPMHQGHDRSNLTAAQSYMHMGTAIAPENGALVNPMDSISRGRVQSPSQWNLQSRASEYHSSSFSMGIPHPQPSFPGPPYHPFQRSSAAGNLYLAPQNNAGNAHSNYYDRLNIHENRSGLLDPVTGSERGPYKRKIPPGISVARESSSPSGFYSAGSSSGSSVLPMGKPTSDYQTIPSGHARLPHYGAGSLPVAGEDMVRNVRPRLDLEANPIRTHSSSYSSHHYHSTINSSSVGPGADNLTNISADETTRVWNLNALPPPARGMIQTSGTNGLSHEGNKALVRESCSGIGGIRPDSVLGRNLIPSSQYFPGGVLPDSVSGRNLIPLQYANAPPIWGAREAGSSHSQRAIPSYRPGLSYPQFGHEAASTVSALQSLSQSYTSRHPRLYTGEWQNSQMNGRPRIAIEQFQSMPSIVDAYDRSGSENVMMINMSLLDEYGDMRLDVDNMSYEELLALGESIGNVSTGLSEDMISKCLTETKNASDQNHGEETCCICLEEYANEEEIGTLKKCGHNYHVNCIREWLLMKNTCPVCKVPALADHSK
ncbi:E3 ubiquitin-protein ligase HIP1 [Actinidia chinensis var. chinensis]|uniref:RING-type E3 ubiquitin transferase n=1 Tax=Actinidia chinensis var. chinensis TaxID=1590841 RepID=A0A2R6RTR4_ACTCC|nr:E3 ubiquitin-protein ligase HIP1 [Actinidia chinensis var. chinensis]